MIQWVRFAAPGLATARCASLALATLLAAGASPAQPDTDAALDQSAPNVYWDHYWISTEDWERRVEFLEYADWGRLRSVGTIVGYPKENTKVWLAYNMAGHISSKAEAFEDDGYYWYTDASVWVGDALRIRVPGAAPGQVTTLRFGGIKKYRGRNAHSEYTQVCAGIVADSHCEADFYGYGINAKLQLPPPENVAEVRRISDLEVEVDVVGPQAVVPLRFAIRHSAYGDRGDRVDVSQVDLLPTVQLPAGVVCHSRSGKAFNGRCPAPGR
jgi:hypothetical protein